MTKGVAAFGKILVFIKARTAGGQNNVPRLGGGGRNFCGTPYGVRHLFAIFDLEALRIRLLRTYSISSPYEEGERIHVQTKEAEFSLLFSGEIKILDQCHVYENHGKRILLSPHLREGLRHFFARVREEGAEPIAVVKKDENGVYTQKRQKR